MRVKILAVDDERDMLALLKRILSDNPAYDLTITDDPLHAQELLNLKTFDILLTDLKMPLMDGMRLLEHCKQRSPLCAVILMTAFGTIDSAVEATRKGAFDYVTKPFRKERILQLIEQALKWQRLELENTILREKLETGRQAPTMIGHSPAMNDLLRQIEQVAQTSATILITGESGTGKELVARNIHVRSRRAQKTFVPVNCGAMPENLIESELFGHVRGAFTGAVRDKKGLVEEARGGTLFLDEIGDISPALQVKLLRLLQEGEFKCVGDHRSQHADLRFIAATHQDLTEKIGKGEFREDLFYRLNVINVQLPPLRDRTEDIPLLASYFFKKYKLLHDKKDVLEISSQAMETLRKYSWPGNVRELENVIERGVILCTGTVLKQEDLALNGPVLAHSAQLFSSEEIFAMPFKDAKDKLVEEFQSAYLCKVLAKHGGNVSQAARDSGIKRQYLHKLMREAQVMSATFKNGSGGSGESA
ncbi:MAG TPA: sigma-54-dependent Fis family transcriptional regulator [Desulfonatronum sp.]|nr:sigma-54-dependent Fis family transcriptional regulator [Desulfonatronum sp.]